MSKISPCLWFDGQAEQAALFYVSVFPDSSIGAISRYTADQGGPSHFPAGTALLVEFTLFGQTYQGLNGGPQHHFSEAISLSVSCADQAEVDRYWNVLTADGGSPGPCGWLTDKFGLSWQIVPDGFIRLLHTKDSAAIGRMMGAMMQMHKMDMAALQAAYDGETV
jgi:predicted 3-demethylubiquinone-9 3-methyltransferase (glyoxalase superfamily)